MTKLKLTYGINSDGHLVHVDFVARGQNCQCTCPKCGAELIAKHGTEKTWHFAHKNGADCKGARMTALHRLAQQIIQTEKKIQKPYFNDYCKDTPDIIEFDAVKLEEYFKIDKITRRPDCVGIKEKDNNKHELWIEIRVTHGVDEKKKKDIISQGIICMEVDLSKLLDTNYTTDSIHDALFTDPKTKSWINYPALFKKNEKEKKRIAKEREKQQKNEEQARQERLSIERKEAENVVNAWLKNGTKDAAENVINGIKNDPYNQKKKTFTIIDSLIPNNNYIHWIIKSPKNHYALNIFYIVLKYYNKQIAKYVDSYELNKELCKFRYKQSINNEEKILLEELISLKIIRKLRYEYDFYSIYHVEFLKELLQKYYSDILFRNKCLQILSIEYRHVVGFKARDFTGLTTEISNTSHDIIPLYLKILDYVHNHQDKYPKHNIPSINDEYIVKMRKYATEMQITANTDCEYILQIAFGYIFGGEFYLKIGNEALSRDDKDDNIYNRDMELDQLAEEFNKMAEKFT